MQSQRVEFSNLNGETLSGVLEVPAGEAAGWAVFAHCFTCSKKSLAASRVARGLAERGIGVLRFDFTGLGESDGDFATSGFSSNVNDLISSVNWMAASGRPVSLMIGHSLGGAATVVAASKLEGVKAVATIGAPSDASHVIDQFKDSVPEIEAEGRARVNLGGRPFTLSRAFLDDVREATVISAVKGLRKPLLILHAPSDEVVGIGNATDLFIAAKHPKSFVSLDTADHLLTGKADSGFVADVISGWSARYIDIGFVQMESRTNGEGAEILFTVEDGSGETVRVSYTGLVPDLFREGEGVVATGRFQPESTLFVAEEILAKHDENYQPRELEGLSRDASGA